MNTDRPVRGIAGLTPRESFGAALTIGRKHPQRGFPIEKDRFHIVLPIEDANGVRQPHPRYQGFNAAAPEHRRVVYGQFMHASITDSWTFNRRCQTVKGKPSHPYRVPFCVGDGVKAVRYAGFVEGDHRFDEIVCPGDRCEYAQPTQGRNGRKGPPLCKPWGKLAFRLWWREGSPLQPVSCKFTTGSWHSISNIEGLFVKAGQLAAAMGLERWHLIGFRFSLTLSEKTNPREQSRFPVVSVTEIDDLAAHLEAQRHVQSLKVIDGPGVNDEPPQIEAADWDIVNPQFPGESQ